MPIGTQEQRQLAFSAFAVALLEAALTAGLTSLLPVVDVQAIALSLLLLVKPIRGFLLGGAVAANATRAALVGRWRLFPVMDTEN